MSFECSKDGVVVSQRMAEVLVWMRCLAESYVCCAVEGAAELMEEVAFDVGHWLEVSLEDVAQCPFQHLLVESERLLCERLSGVLSVVEVFDYQSKGAPSCGAGAKKGRLLFCCLVVGVDGSGGVNGVCHITIL